MVPVIGTTVGTGGSWRCRRARDVRPRDQGRAGRRRGQGLVVGAAWCPRRRDEASISGLLESYLEREGFDVDVTSDGESGVERARNHRPDVIVLT